MRTFSLIVAMTLVWLASPTMAQLPPARITLDAAASFEDAPDPPLELKVQNPITFGKVTIPNGLNAKSVCRYQLFSDSGAGVNTQVEELVDGVRVANSNAGCAFLGNPDVGIIQVRCRQGLNVNHNITYNSAGIKGADFGPVESVMVGEFGAARGTEPRRFGNLPKSGRFQCTTTEGTGVGTSFLFINGALRVTDVASLPRGSNVTVGTVQVDVSY